MGGSLPLSVPVIGRGTPGAAGEHQAPSSAIGGRDVAWTRAGVPARCRRPRPCCLSQYRADVGDGEDKSGSRRRWPPLATGPTTTGLAWSAGVGAAVLALFLIAGCARQSAAGERSLLHQNWESIGFGDDTDQLEVTYGVNDPEGPERCREPHRVVVVSQTSTEVRIRIDVEQLLAHDPDCRSVLVTETVTLDDPLGDRLLYNDTNATGWGAVDGEIVIVDPIECEGCNATEAPVGCSIDAVRLAVEANIDGGMRLAGDPRCTATHLVVDIDLGSGGCPPVESVSPCADVETAFFEARDGLWQVVTYGEGETCATVADATGIQFPAEVC
jgi:hypothetical protein